jgi:hypothetical protein
MKTTSDGSGPSSLSQPIHGICCVTSWGLRPDQIARASLSPSMAQTALIAKVTPNGSALGACGDPIYYLLKNLPSLEPVVVWYAILI